MAACWFGLACVIEHSEAHLEAQDRSRTGEVEGMLRKSTEILEATEGPSQNLVAALNKLASIMDQSGRSTEAEPLLRKVCSETPAQRMDAICSGV